MVKQQILEENKDLIKSWSDQNLMIRKIGTDEIYSEAIDPISMNRKYEETDIPIEQEEEIIDESTDSEN